MASILFVLLQYWFLMTSYEAPTWVVGNILKASGWSTSFFQVYQKCDLSNSNGDLLLKRPRLLIVTVVTISVPLCYSTTLCVPMSLVGLSFTLCAWWLIYHSITALTVPFQTAFRVIVFTVIQVQSVATIHSFLFLFWALHGWKGNCSKVANLRANGFVFLICVTLHENFMLLKTELFSLISPCVCVGPFIIMFCSVNSGSLIIISLFFSLLSVASA